MDELFKDSDLFMETVLMQEVGVVLFIMVDMLFLFCCSFFNMMVLLMMYSLMVLMVLLVMCLMVVVNSVFEVVVVEF